MRFEHAIRHAMNSNGNAAAEHLAVTLLKISDADAKRYVELLSRTKALPNIDHDPSTKYNDR